MEKPHLTQEYVCASFEYRDGELFWKERPIEECVSYRAYITFKNKYVGKKAGSIMVRGYESVAIKQKRFYAHRIIFLMHHGYLPEQIDHIDGNPINNKIENLRAATGTDNNYNKRLSSKNTSGYKNICWSKDKNKWQVSLGYKHKNIFIGYFSNIEEAAQAARQAREVLHGEFARHE